MAASDRTQLAQITAAWTGSLERLALTLRGLIYPCLVDKYIITKRSTNTRHNPGFFKIDCKAVAFFS